VSSLIFVEAFSVVDIAAPSGMQVTLQLLGTEARQSLSLEKESGVELVEQL
jgi:hypothetical protein